MKLIFEKSDPRLVAFFLTVHIEPTPYTVEDRGSHVLIRLNDDIAAERAYALGFRSEFARQMIPGIVKGYRKMFPRPLSDRPAGFEPWANR